MACTLDTVDHEYPNLSSQESFALLWPNSVRLVLSKKGLAASSDRFNYDYADEELREIADHIGTLSRAVPTVHAILNNNYQDQGQRNARTLAGFLQ